MLNREESSRTIKPKKLIQHAGVLTAHVDSGH